MTDCAATWCRPATTRCRSSTTPTSSTTWPPCTRTSWAGTTTSACRTCPVAGSSSRPRRSRPSSRSPTCPARSRSPTRAGGCCPSGRLGSTTWSVRPPRPRLAQRRAAGHAAHLRRRGLEARQRRPSPRRPHRPARLGLPGRGAAVLGPDLVPRAQPGPAAGEQGGDHRPLPRAARAPRRRHRRLVGPPARAEPASAWPRCSPGRRRSATRPSWTGGSGRPWTAPGGSEPIGRPSPSGVRRHGAKPGRATRPSPTAAGPAPGRAGAGRAPGRSRALDAGAGSGVAGEALRTRARAWSPPTASSTWRPTALGPAVTADVTALPFRDRAFDVVVAAFVVNHLPDPVAGLAELRRVTRPRGAVLASTFSVERAAAKGAVDEVAAAHGFVPPGWYADLQAVRARRRRPGLGRAGAGGGRVRPLDGHRGAGRRRAGRARRRGALPARGAAPPPLRRIPGRRRARRVRRRRRRGGRAGPASGSRRSWSRPSPSPELSRRWPSATARRNAAPCSAASRATCSASRRGRGRGVRRPGRVGHVGGEPPALQRGHLGQPRPGPR